MILAKGTIRAVISEPNKSVFLTYEDAQGLASFMELPIEAMVEGCIERREKEITTACILDKKLVAERIITEINESNVLAARTLKDIRKELKRETIDMERIKELTKEVKSELKTADRYLNFYTDLTI